MKCLVFPVYSSEVEQAAAAAAQFAVSAPRFVPVRVQRDTAMGTESLRELDAA